MSEDMSRKEQARAMGRIYSARYREAHKDELRAKANEYNRTHKEARRAYREAHKDEINARARARYAELTPDERREKLETRRARAYQRLQSLQNEGGEEL